MTKPAISIIGIGRVGGALALALAAKGYRIENLIVRSSGGEEKAQTIADAVGARVLSPAQLSEIASEVVFIAVQDAKIENAAAALAAQLPIADRLRQSFVFHLSGALSSDVLSQLSGAGWSVGSIHPLVSISDPQRGAQRFERAFFCIEGAADAVSIAQKIVANLGGQSFSIPTQNKVLYHAAAVTACGHLVALLDAAFEMMAAAGAPNGGEILFPLIKSTIENLAVQTTAEALTGTFARADVLTFEKHLAAIKAHVSPEIMEIYLTLGDRSLDLARRQGADWENLQRMRKEILLAKNNLKC